MPLPLLPIIIGSALLGTATKAYGSTRESRFNDRQADAAKRDARRAAIERAMGGTSISRGQTIINPPDLTWPGALGGLAGVAGSIAGLEYGRKP